MISLLDLHFINHEFLCNCIRHLCFKYSDINQCFMSDIVPIEKIYIIYNTYMYTHIHNVIYFTYIYFKLKANDSFLFLRIKIFHHINVFKVVLVSDNIHCYMFSLSSFCLCLLFLTSSSLS